MELWHWLLREPTHDPLVRAQSTTLPRELAVSLFRLAALPVVPVVLAVVVLLVLLVVATVVVVVVAVLAVLVLLVLLVVVVLLVLLVVVALMLVVVVVLGAVVRLSTTTHQCDPSQQAIFGEGTTPSATCCPHSPAVYVARRLR